jgi:adenylylsulfate kinase-like enzyme
LNVGKIYWFTGQPCSGKTTLANLLIIELEKLSNKKVFHVDGDELRELFDNKKYGKEGREENIRRAQDIAKFISNTNHDVVVSLVSPYLELRETFKSNMSDNLIELYVHTDKIRCRELFHMSEYEKPKSNFIDVNTTNISPEETINFILKNLNK